jgi:Glycosyl transferase family 2
MNQRRAHDSRALDGSPDRAPVVAAVLPAYQTASSIRSVIEQIPADIRHVIVVDDPSPDGVGPAVSALGDPRIFVCTHEANCGVVDLDTPPGEPEGRGLDRASLRPGARRRPAAERYALPQEETAELALLSTLHFGLEEADPIRRRG